MRMRGWMSGYFGPVNLIDERGGRAERFACKAAVTKDPPKRSRARVAWTALSCVLGLSLSFKAISESSDTGETAPALDEIVVTASKRVSTVQDTPISITAVSGGDLLARGVASLAALAQGTPGVSLKSEGPSQTEIEMRGMTSSGGNSATVGFYLDDIPLAGPASAQNGHVVIDPDLYDLNRIEILRGPQGTLFGSGSMGGTVRLISNQPNLSQFQSSARSVLSGTDGGGFNHKDNLMVNLPLIDDTLALRVVGTENYTSGWIDRIVADPFPLVGGNPAGTVRGNVQDAPFTKQYPGSNAYQIYATRVTLLWRPTEGLSITPSILPRGDPAGGSKRGAQQQHPMTSRPGGRLGALSAVRHRRTADGFADGLWPQCELQFPDVRCDIEYRPSGDAETPGQVEEASESNT